MRRALAAVLATLTLAACDASAEVPWEVRGADPSILDRAAILETSVRRGGCEGVLVYREAIARDRRGPAPSLGRGLHGFSAEARDAECRPIARGCVERDLPLLPGDRVDLVLERVLPVAACAASACVDGTCIDRDAGVIERDAGSGDGGPPELTDAAPADGGPPDVDDAAVPLDAGPLDALDAGRPDPPDAGPPPTCDGTEWSGRCYAFRSDARDWSTAEASCVAWGGHLVSLGGPDEESFVRGLATGTYWIGLNDLLADDIFTWVDGSSASYRHWSGGAPSGNPMFHCTSDDPASAWQLRRCRDSLAYACER